MGVDDNTRVLCFRQTVPHKNALSLAVDGKLALCTSTGLYLMVGGIVFQFYFISR